MPIVCVLIPNYKCALARLAQPALRDRPLIVADRLERGHAIDLDAAAFALGARVGMTLVQAGACAREAAIAVDDPARNAGLWERLLDTLDAASPLVEDAGEGVAFVEMRGISPRGAREAALERRWIASVHGALDSLAERRNLDLRAALAPNRFVARAAASAGDGTIVRAGDERGFVAPFSLETLGLDRATVERLHLLGITDLGALAALPHGPFVRRFGPEAARWHAHASGRDDVPVVPRPRRLTIDRALLGEGSADREDQLLFALRTLVSRVADDVADAGKRCGFLRLTLECEDGETLELPTTLAQPTAQGGTMFDLLRARLEGITNEGAPLRSPVVGLRLGAERLEDGGTPLSLFAGSDPDPEAVAIAIARLEAALGPGTVLHARAVPGFRFESQYAYAPFDPSAVARPRAGFDGAKAREAALPLATLTYRIVPPREIAVRIARGAPAEIDGRSVLDCAGPWRSDEGWWSQALSDDDTAVQKQSDMGERVACDTYDVLLDDGRLMRIACDVASEGRCIWVVLGRYD